MTIKNLNTKRQAGFTIVELLIVIVVIGILAAITIVSYSGITARANATKALTNAANVQKVVEAYNADPLNTGYPDLTALNAYSALTTSVAKVPAGIIISGTAPLATNGTTTLHYLAKGTTGGCIGYWDFAATPSVKYVLAGNAVSSNGTTCI